MLVGLFLASCGPTDDNHLPTDLHVLLQQARQGDVNAQYKVALRYRLGQGVIQNDRQALRWMARAAEQNHPAAQYELGSYYTLPEYPDHDDRQAAYWLRKSAEQGYAPAQFSLGVLYHAGRGVKRDPAEAYAWLAVAADQGDEEAARARDTLAAPLSETEREQARQRYQRYRLK